MQALPLNPSKRVRRGREFGLVVKFTGVSLIGFVVDLTVLQSLLWAGLEPAWARVISLICAMHMTFVINGLHVFKGLDRRCWRRQWASYLLTNGFGNFCNYWIFVTLVSTHWPLVSTPPVGVVAGSACAWAINYLANRFLVFPQRLDALRACDADGQAMGRAARR